MLRKLPKKKTCAWSKCKQQFTPQRTTQKTCNNYMCAMGYVNENPKKVKEEMITKEVKELKVKSTKWDESLQDKINQIVRLIDFGLPCLARNHFAKQIHAGHIFSRGSNKTIRFHLHNIHRQGAQSNHFQNDDGLLREGLTKEYGEQYMDFISELRRIPALKYTNEEYHQFYLKACKIVNRMKKDHITKTVSQRWILRDQINLELGIYKQEYCTFLLTINN